MKTHKRTGRSRTAKGVARGSMQRRVRATNPKMSDQEYYEYVTDCQNGYGHLWRNK